MTIVILTTDTPHHVYFVREIARAFPDLHVVDEQQRIVPRFETRHPFEDARDAFERSRWFDGRVVLLRDLAQTTAVDSVNDLGLAALDVARPDVVVSFGVGRISATVIGRFHGRIVNLHGGDPGEYRGLDSHLWAIYHRDWRALVATLHAVNESFDDGAIIAQAPVPLHRGMALHELRAANTEACTAMTLEALRTYMRIGTFPLRAQQQKGRYYSSMPAVLKAICIEQFTRYTATLEACLPERRMTHVRMP